jgi:hypothetical protein
MNTAKAEPAAAPKQVRRAPAMGREAREIPVIRALTSYGMTKAQVAQLYEVTVDEIEKIISRPDQPRKS